MVAQPKSKTNTYAKKKKKKKSGKRGRKNVTYEEFLQREEVNCAMEKYYDYIFELGGSIFFFSDFKLQYILF